MCQPLTGLCHTNSQGEVNRETSAVTMSGNATGTGKLLCLQRGNVNTAWREWEAFKESTVKSGMAGLCGRYIFGCLRNLHGSHIGCTSSHSHQQWISVAFPPASAPALIAC